MCTRHRHVNLRRLTCTFDLVQYLLYNGDAPESDWAVLDDFRRMRGGGVVTLAPTFFNSSSRDWSGWRAFARPRNYNSSFPLFQVGPGCMKRKRGKTGGKKGCVENEVQKGINKKGRAQRERKEPL